MSRLTELINAQTQPQTGGASTGGAWTGQMNAAPLMQSGLLLKILSTDAQV